MATSAPKVTIMSGGIPYTAGSQAKAQAMVAKDAPVAPSGSAKTDPARGAPGWIDPIRAPGDTTYTDKFGTPNAADLAGANAPGTATPTSQAAQQAATNTPQAPGMPQTATTAQNALPGALTPTAPVITPPASPTPVQNKYSAGLNAAQQSGTPPPVDAGAARTAVSAYTPPQSPDTSQADAMISSDPGMTQIMGNINQLLNAKNQTTSLMQDYQKLYNQSGLGAINAEMINADKVINGTEDDVRNEIQKAGGFGTDSQVQALSLARNKSLIARYNQLSQMKTDATNQLNTMMQLDGQDKQMAQQKLDSQISTMFQMANFRQTAIQHTQQQQQFLLTTMGADGYFASVSQDPGQLATAEKIMGVAPGGLQKMAVQAAQSRALDVQQKQAAINASYASADASRASAAKDRAAMTGSVDPATVAAWAQNIRSGSAKLSDISGSPALKNAVTVALSQGGSPQSEILSTTNTSLQKLQDMVDKNKGFSGPGGAVGFLAAATGGGKIPGTPGADFLAQFNQTKNDVVLPNLTLLHGLGRVTDREFQALTSAVTSLSPTESPAKFKSDLQTLSAQIAAKSADTAPANTPAPQPLLAPTQIPSGFYQASDGLLYKK